METPLLTVGALRSVCDRREPPKAHRPFRARAGRYSALFPCVVCGRTSPVAHPRSSRRRSRRAAFHGALRLAARPCRGPRNPSSASTCDRGVGNGSAPVQGQQSRFSAHGTETGRPLHTGRHKGFRSMRLVPLLTASVSYQIVRHRASPASWAA